MINFVLILVFFETILEKGGLLIRTAKLHETELLSELTMRSKGHWGYSEEFLEQCREELTVKESYLQTHLVYVLESSGKIVGYYSLGKVTEQKVELDALFVDSTEIGKGYGGSLAKDAKTQAREAGYQIMTIQGDPNAEDFYKAIGGVVVGTRESESIPGRYLPLLEIDLTIEIKNSIFHS